MLPQIETITIDAPQLIESSPELVEWAGKHSDLEVIREVLMERGEPLTIDNARFILAIGLRNKPAAWTITPEELPGMWAEMVGLND